MLIFLRLEPKCETKANWGKKKEGAPMEGAKPQEAAAASVTVKPGKARTTTKKKNPLEDADTVEEKSL